MKKIVSIFVFVLLILNLSSCFLFKRYSAPVECLKTETGESVELTEEEQKIILDVIDEGKWTYDIVKCLCDYKFTFENGEMSYHSECGHFVDYKNRRTLSISNENKEKINAILFADN